MLLSEMNRPSDTIRIKDTVGSSMLHKRYKVKELRSRAENRLELLALLARFDEQQEISLHEVIDSIGRQSVKTSYAEVMLLLLNDYLHQI